MDDAYANAVAQRDRLSAEISKLEQRLAAVKREHDRAVQFIDNWEHFAGMKRPADSAPVVTPAESGAAARLVNPPKERVAEVALQVLDEVNRPLNRADLFKAVTERGIVIKGKDPIVTFSTMLWRMKGVIRSVPGVGYWAADRPLPGALAEQEQDAKALFE